MRWQGQELGVADAGALPGLEQLNGLVRSVTTPEFAGVTFHEVMCKSALNHVPGASAMPTATSARVARRGRTCRGGTISAVSSCSARASCRVAGASTGSDAETTGSGSVVRGGSTTLSTGAAARSVDSWAR